MSLPTFTDILSLSIPEISEAIGETEKHLFKLRTRKSIRQKFKPNQIKTAKRRLAQLKTLLKLRLEKMTPKK